MNLGRRIRSRGQRFVAFGWLSSSQRKYVRLIKHEKGLDRQHYANAHAWLHWAERRFPERHYVALGETLGLSPSGSFVPGIYRRLNPEVPVDTAPLLHYLTVGRDQGLGATEPFTAPLPGPSALTPRSRVAVVAHVHYRELWPELVRCFARSGLQADLFVTLTQPPHQDHSAARIDIERALGETFPNRSIGVVPNRGRDIAPFIQLVNAGVLDGYEAVCKVHTKQSPGRNGEQWRDDLLAAILPSNTRPWLDCFLGESDALVAAAPQWIRSGPDAWGMNKERVVQLLGEQGPAKTGVAPYPAGSMYWIKQAVLAELRSLQLSYDDFGDEIGQVDGTMAHAVERMIGYLCARAHGRVVATSMLVPA